MNKINAIGLTTLKLWRPLYLTEINGMEHISLLRHRYYSDRYNAVPEQIYSFTKS
jgi:hypothetical protein